MTLFFVNDIIPLNIANIYAIFQNNLPNIDIMKQNFFYEAGHDKADTISFHYSENVYTPPHFHRCIEILYVKQGGIDFEVNGEAFHADRDDIVFVHKCGVHALQPAPAYTDYVLIIGPRYSNDFAGIFRTKALPTHLTDKEYNRKVLPCMSALHELKETDSELIKKGYTDVIIGHLLSHYEKVSVPLMPKIETVVNVLNYIDDHYRDPITLDSISSEFGYNKYYFSRLFNSYVGETLNGYINMIRIRNMMDEAGRTENPNVSELVFSNGFDSMTTFYRSFSKLYDKPPTEVFKDI